MSSNTAYYVITYYMEPCLTFFLEANYPNEVYTWPDKTGAHYERMSNELSDRLEVSYLAKSLIGATQARYHEAQGSL